MSERKRRVRKIERINSRGGKQETDVNVGGGCEGKRTEKKVMLKIQEKERDGDRGREKIQEVGEERERMTEKPRE